jgi:2-polyprenyl-3-methyl-5-hydroxy-6-metoxy-1,4-benzoquinol methylase
VRERFPQVEVVHALFEDFEPERPFDNIIMGHVLEHVEHPIEILTSVRGWLSPNGRVFCAVPNARSLHRQAAVVMGLLPKEDALNDLDVHHGHRRIYTPETLRAAFIEAGFKIEVFGGYFLKPISNGQIESAWTSEMVDAFIQMGERYPDIAGEIYVVAETK